MSHKYGILHASKEYTVSALTNDIDCFKINRDVERERNLYAFLVVHAALKNTSTFRSFLLKRKDGSPCFDFGNDAAVVCRRILGAKASERIVVVTAGGKGVFVGDAPEMLFLRFIIFADVFDDEKLHDGLIRSENSLLTLCARINFAAISRAF